MRLPPAVPASCSTPVRVELTRCWARNEEPLTPAAWSCNNEPADDFGLCQMHRGRILGGDRA